MDVTDEQQPPVDDMAVEDDVGNAAQPVQAVNLQPMVGDLDELNLINNVGDPVDIGLNQQADDHPPIITRSGRTVRLTDKGREYRQSLGLATLSELDVDEPQSYKEAMQSPFSEEWLEAFRVEFCARQAINSI
jgi:hypothetical protein